jgi:hypothetical protein
MCLVNGYKVNYKKIIVQILLILIQASKIIKTKATRLIEEKAQWKEHYFYFTIERKIIRSIRARKTVPRNNKVVLRKPINVINDHGIYINCLFPFTL